MSYEKELEAVLKFTVSNASIQRTEAATGALQKRIQQQAEETGKKLRDEAEKAAKAAEDAARQADVVARKMQLLRDAADVGGEIAEGFALAGAAISGPLLLSINSYINAAGDAERTSQRWMAATDRLSESQQRVGRVAAQAVLPLLEQAASLAEKAAKFAEDNPDLVAAALKIGTVTAALGAVGTAVSRGIRLVADAKQLAAEAAAAKLQDIAADKMLAAAGIQAQAAGGSIGGSLLKGGGAVAGGAAVAGSLSAGALAGIVGAGAAFQGGLMTAGMKGVDAIGDKVFGRDIYSGYDLLTDLADGVKSLLGAADESADNAESAAKAWKDLADTTQDSAKVSAESWETAVQEFIDYQEGLDELTTSKADERAEIVTKYADEMTQAEKEAEQARLDLIEEFSQSAQDALDEFSRSEARTRQQYNDSQLQTTQDYLRQQREAEEQYYQQRAQLARDFGIETARMEEDHQREMQRLREDYDLQEQEAIINRDASALLSTRSDYARERDRAEEDYGVEMSRRNEDYALQLADQETQYQAQREQRAEEYQRQIAEAREQYEQQAEQRREDFELQQAEQRERFDEEMATLDINSQDELERLRIAKTNELTQLDQHYTDEANLRNQRFTESISQLDGHLLGQQTTALNYYAQMEADFSTWLNGMRGQLSATPSAALRGRAGGGYADYGAYTLGESGREFVLSAPTTRRLEGALGNLNQEKVISLTMSPSFNNVSGADQAWIMSELQRVQTDTVSIIARTLGGN